MKGKKVRLLLTVAVLLISVSIIGVVWVLTEDKAPAAQGDTVVSVEEKTDQSDTTADASSEQTRTSDSQKNDDQNEDDVIIELDENEWIDGV